MKLDRFDNRAFSRGRSRLFEAWWILIRSLCIDCWIPGSRHRVWLLRHFGAVVGQGVVIKPRVRITFPWKLTIGDHAWLGEGCWIDNLAEVSIGSHVCVSQRAYLCTGSHDWSAERFDLIVKAIDVEKHAWLCAASVVGPGVTVGEGAILALGSVATGDMQAWTIYQGVPAVAVKKRKMSEMTGQRLSESTAS